MKIYRVDLNKAIPEEQQGEQEGEQKGGGSPQQRAIHAWYASHGKGGSSQGAWLQRKIANQRDFQRRQTDQRQSQDRQQQLNKPQDEKKMQEEQSDMAKKIEQRSKEVVMKTLTKIGVMR